MASVCEVIYLYTIIADPVSVTEAAAGRSSMGAIIGGAVGGLVAIVILAVILVVLILLTVRWLNHKKGNILVSYS